MWNQQRSLLLTRACLWLMTLAVFILLLGGPWIVPALQTHGIIYFYPHNAVPFFCTMYTGGIALLALMWHLGQLIKNISQNLVFVAENVTLLRRISWCCAVGGLIGIFSAFYYFSWIFVGLSASFVMLIVRVVKNVMAQAVELKEEHDFTI